MAKEEAFPNSRQVMDLSLRAKPPDPDSVKRRRVLELLYCRFERELLCLQKCSGLEEAIFLSMIIYELDTIEPYVQPQHEALRKLAFAYAILFGLTDEELDESDDDDRCSDAWEDDWDMDEMEERAT